LNFSFRSPDRPLSFAYTVKSSFTVALFSTVCFFFFFVFFFVLMFLFFVWSWLFGVEGFLFVLFPCLLVLASAMLPFAQVALLSFSFLCPLFFWAWFCFGSPFGLKGFSFLPLGAYLSVWFFFLEVYVVWISFTPPSSFCCTLGRLFLEWCVSRERLSSFLLWLVCVFFAVFFPNTAVTFFFYTPGFLVSLFSLSFDVCSGPILNLFWRSTSGIFSLYVLLWRFPFSFLMTNFFILTSEWDWVLCPSDCISEAFFLFFHPFSHVYRSFLFFPRLFFFPKLIGFVSRLGFFQLYLKSPTLTFFPNFLPFAAFFSFFLAPLRLASLFQMGCPPLSL